MHRFVEHIRRYMWPYSDVADSGGMAMVWWSRGDRCASAAWNEKHWANDARPWLLSLLLVSSTIPRSDDSVRSHRALGAIRPDSARGIVLLAD